MRLVIKNQCEVVAGKIMRHPWTWGFPVTRRLSDDLNGIIPLAVPSKRDGKEFWLLLTRRGPSHGRLDTGIRSSSRF